MGEQLDIFGTATPIAATAPSRPAGDQLALFRPDFAAMRAPKQRGAAALQAAEAAAIDPALHGDTLI